MTTAGLHYQSVKYTRQKSTREKYQVTDKKPSLDNNRFLSRNIIGHIAISERKEQPSNQEYYIQNYPSE
jgi:hypothetical protein